MQQRKNFDNKILNKLDNSKANDIIRYKGKCNSIFCVLYTNFSQTPNEKKNCLLKYTKTKRNMYKQLKLVSNNNPLGNAYMDEIKTINLISPGNRNNRYIDINDKFLNDSDESASIFYKGIQISSKYRDLQHELLHFMNHIKDPELIDNRTYIKDIIAKTENTPLKDFIDYYKDAMIPEDGYENPQTVIKYIYDNSVEMQAMYGIKYKDGAFYYDPINEAVADAEGRFYNNERKSIIRTGHYVNLKKGQLEDVDEGSTIYKWHFDPALRNLITL